MLKEMNLYKIQGLVSVLELAEQGYPLQEIADMKGLDIEAIKQNLIDAEKLLKELREQFDEFKF